MIKAEDIIKEIEERKIVIPEDCMVDESFEDYLHRFSSTNIGETNMSKLIISDAVMNGVKDTKIVNEEKSEEYKKLVEESNKRIRENRRREAEAWIKASTYISD